MAAGDNRGHGGNAGYDDQVDAYYSWDSNVPNAKKISPGDVVVLWDKERVLGVSVVEQIDVSRGTKVLNRCPACGTTRIAVRKSATPRYRCMKDGCHAEFNDPSIDVVAVDQYVARYDAAWTSLDGVVDTALVKALAVHRGDFNAMRPLDGAKLRLALGDRHAQRALARIDARETSMVPLAHAGTAVDFTQGFVHSVVRVRRGQTKFREHILALQGETCAFTGPAPRRALEAGHLYSYARLGEHHAHGGMMLRRDIHRLFDDGLIAVDPGRLVADVSPELERYPQYARLHDAPLSIDVRDDQVDWLARHWNEHRVTPAMSDS